MKLNSITNEQLDIGECTFEDFQDILNLLPQALDFSVSYNYKEQRFTTTGKPKFIETLYQRIKDACDS